MVALTAAQQRPVDLGALVQPVDIGLPREADSAMSLDGAPGDLPSAGGGGRVGRGGGAPQPRRVGVDRPGRVVGGGTRALGVQEHLGAAMADRLEGADRDAELLALLDV